MFGSKRIKDLEAENAELREAVTRLKAGYERHMTARAASPVLTGIYTEGRNNVFTFIRNGETFMIKTYSTMRDNIPGWKEKAGLK